MEISPKLSGGLSCSRNEWVKEGFTEDLHITYCEFIISLITTYFKYVNVIFLFDFVDITKACWDAAEFGE